jgi:hypothetical protein
LAPAITAFYFDDHLGDWWPFATGVTALIGAALMLTLRKHLSEIEDGRGLRSTTLPVTQPTD